MIVEDLHLLKYNELQKLAKSAGIKANQKVDKLVKALSNHYAQTESELKKEDCTKSDDVSVLESSSNSSIEPTMEGAENTGTPGRKRRRTFELEEPTLEDGTPVIEQETGRVTRLQTSRGSTPQEDTEAQPSKRLRRNTYDKNSPLPTEAQTQSKGSPSTRSIIDSITGDCSSAERKEMLLSAINKRVQMKMVSSPLKQTKSQPSQIPRFMAFLSNERKENKKPVTPGNKDWNKIHNKAFSKLDSLDVYLEKKQQRIDNLTGSSKKQRPKKSPAVKKPVVKNPKSSASQQPISSKAFKPAVTSAKNINFDFTGTSSKSALKESASAAGFKPSVTSTKNLNFNFTTTKSTTSDSAKTPRSKAGTPSRRGAPTSTKVKDITSSSKTTPFVFTGNTSTMNTSVASAKKPAFDLKASLARPLTWKPHTGKLQTLDTQTSRSASVPKSGSVVDFRKSRKVISRDAATTNRPVQAKNIRRMANVDRRNNQKYVDMMKRRGLIP